MSSRKARLGFIGAGWWATANHMPILAQRDDVELAAVCRLGKRELAQVQERFRIPYGTEDAADLVRQPGLDGVVISSPHTLHYEHARLALEHGLHVLCEKPMCTRGDHARELVQLARRQKRHLLVAYGWHYQPLLQQAKRFMEEGAIGFIEFAMCHMASPIRTLLQGQRFLTGSADSTSGQAGQVMFEPEAATWADPKLAGGGYGHAQLSHITGLLFWLTGLTPEFVYALMRPPGTNVELYGALSVIYVGGTTGTISGAGTVPPVGTGQYQLDIRLFGTEGMLLIDCERPRVELRTHAGRLEQLHLSPAEAAYTCDGPPNNFADLILGKTDVSHAPGEVALRSVLLLDAAYRSAVSGKVEQVQ
jgi:predicted dehydrogenase